MRIVGVVPAAGFATRLQPLPCSKEVYPVGGRPVMDYVVERMRAAAADEIRVVIRPEKTDVAQNALQLGLEVVEGHPRDLGASIALGLAGLTADDVVLLGFPDSIWEPPDGYARLMSALASEYEVALGLFSTDSPETCDVVNVDRSGLVRGIEHRPQRPATNVIWGAATCRMRALAEIEDARDPGILFGRLCRTRPIRGVWLSHAYVDVGTREMLTDPLGKLAKRARVAKCACKKP